MPKPNQKTLAALERVFAAEVDGRCLFQSKAKIYSDLCASGLVVEAEVTLGGRFPVVIKGYQLTHAGRIMYCSNCGGDE